jgi:hypothetical protein
VSSNLIHIWLHKRFDAIHLAVQIVVPYFCVWVFFDEVVSSNCCSTSWWRYIMTHSSYLSNFAFPRNTDMRCKKNYDVSISWYMTCKSTPSCLTTKWQSSQSWYWKNFTPSISQQNTYVLFWIIVINLIWTCTLTKQSVICRKSIFIKNIINNLLDWCASHASFEMLIQYLTGPSILDQLWFWFSDVNGLHAAIASSHF